MLERNFDPLMPLQQRSPHPFRRAKASREFVDRSGSSLWAGGCAGRSAVSPLLACSESFAAHRCNRQLGHRVPKQKGQITAAEPCTRSPAPLGSVKSQPFNRAPIATAEAVIRLQIMPFLGVCSALTTRSPPYG